MRIINYLWLLGLFNLITIGFAFAQTEEGYVKLNGQLKGFSNLTEVENLSEYQYLSIKENDRFIIPDSSGNFNIRFKIKAANYYRLGRNILYLTPGDSLNMVIENNDPRMSRFEGRGRAANEYLKNIPFPKAGSFLESGRKLLESPTATVELIERAAEERRATLKNTFGISDEFRRLEQARIKADIINSIYSGERYGVFKFKLNDSAAIAFAKKYREQTEQVLAKYTKNFVDPTLLKLAVYRDIADNIVSEGSNKKDILIIKDYYKALTLVREMQKVSDKSELKQFVPKVEQIATFEYQLAVKGMLTKLLEFGKGDIASDFEAFDEKGNRIKLSSLKGKIIYVDLWATWCGPCMMEMPAFETLKSKYKANTNIAFISLSIDENEGAWKQSLKSRKADGFQWIINRNRLKDYNVVGIPRSFLIDKNFRMLDLDAPMPSDIKLVKLIDDLLAR